MTPHERLKALLLPKGKVAVGASDADEELAELIREVLTDYENMSELVCDLAAELATLRKQEPISTSRVPALLAKLKPQGTST